MKFPPLLICLYSCYFHAQIFPNNDTFNFRKIETGDDEDESDDSDVECDETFDISKVKEMRLVPSDPSQCMYYLFLPPPFNITHVSFF